MKKTFNINISGYVFTIDDDAYDLLKDYLDTLHHAFASQEDGAELIADIEQRMAEILGQQNDGGMRVITIADAEAIIARMGRPEEIIEDETVEWRHDGHEGQSDEKNGHAEAPPYNPAQEQTVRRKFFRNPYNKMLGGVCSGLAAYIGIDPTWMRLIAVLLAFASFSVAVIIYIILWIIVPEARTTLDFMQMQGKAPTMENIGQTVTDTFRRMGDTFSNSDKANRPGTHGSADFAKTEPRSTGKVMADGLASFFGFVGKVLLIIGIVVCTIIEAALGIGLLGCIIALITFITPYGMTMFGDGSLAGEHDIVIMGLLTAIGYILTIGIPLFFLLRFMLNNNNRIPQRMAKGWRVAMIATWIIGFIMAGVCTGIIVAHEQRGDWKSWHHNADRHREVIYDTVVVEETGILDGESESEERIDSLKQEIRRNRDSLKENAKALKEEMKKNR